MTTAATTTQPHLCFVHIPKTAGTTVRALVEQHYPAERVAPTSRVKERMKAWGVTKRELAFGGELEDIWLYCGHSNVTPILPERYRRFTFMRDPVARLNSQFNHWVAWTYEEIEKSPSAPEVKALKHSAKENTLEDFLTINAGAVKRLFRNGQCKTLVGNFPIQYNKTLKDQQLLDAVRKNLDDMIFVGITERLADSLRLLCYTLEWPPPVKVDRLNARKRDRTLDDARLPAIVEDAVALDRGAYAHATERFERDHAAMLDDLGLAPGAHETDLDGVIEAIDARSRAALVDSGEDRAHDADVRMTDGVRGTGWHELERTRTGHAYRWTGPGTRTTLDLLVRPADRFDVSVGVVSLLHRDVLKGARVRINGVEPERCKVEWRLPFADHDPAMHRIHATISGRPVGDDGFCRIEILTPRTHRAEDVEPGCGDTRDKGLAITSVRVEPR